jgi:ABC-type dipeptide/oligopeptide/nickel transport system ATPase component
MKTVYVVPRPSGSGISIDDMRTIQKMMGGIADKAIELKVGNFDNFADCVMPGGQEANEAFGNLQMLKKLADQSSLRAMKLPSDADENIANIMKFVFQYLNNEHNHGRALTGHSVHTSMEQLVAKINSSVQQKEDPGLMDFLFKLGVADQSMVSSNYPSFFSQGMPQKSIFTPPIIKVAVEKFIRDNYPVNFQVKDLSEIDTLVQAFSQRYPVGVPMDTLGNVFLEVCQLK